MSTLRRREGLLWKIQPTGVVKTQESFLFGTMHVFDEQMMHWLTKLEPYIEKCEQFYAESDLNDLQQMNFGELQDHFQYYGLHDALSPKKFAKMSHIFSKSFHVDLSSISHLLPMFIQQIVTMSAMKQIGGSLDEKLWHLAGEMRLPRYGIESANRQLEIAKMIPIRQQIKVLEQIARNPNKFRKKMMDLQEDYHAQRLSSMYKKTRNQMGSLRKLMVNERNERMAKVIGSAAQEQSSFFCCGAAHLVGKYGLLRLLKHQNFKLTLQS